MSFSHLMIAEFLQSFNLIYSFSGFFVGMLVGFTGVGGGSLMTPLLVLLFNIHPATAVGTDLLYAGVTKAFGTGVHSHKKSVDWKIVGLLALGSIPSTLIALYYVNLYGKSPQFVSMMKMILGYLLLATAIFILARGYILKFSKEHYHAGHEKRTAFYTILVGIIIGTLVSITSVGAGAIGVTALILLYPRISTLRIVGSDIAHAVPLTLFAGAGYIMMGEVDYGLLLSLLIGSIPGILLGSWLAPKLPEKVLRTLLAIILSIVGYKMLVTK